MHRFAPLLLYLDSNVLFSACYDPISPFLKFWRMADVTPVTSPYAVNEVNRHIRLAAHQVRFDRLLTMTLLVRDANPDLVPKQIALAEKDRPILAAAIASSVDYLVTGDKHHFTYLYSKRIAHVLVISPADFLNRYEDRLMK